MNTTTPNNKTQEVSPSTLNLRVSRKEATAIYAALQNLAFHTTSLTSRRFLEQLSLEVRNTAGFDINQFHSSVIDAVSFSAANVTTPVFETPVTNVAKPTLRAAGKKKPGWPKGKSRKPAITPAF